MCVSVAIAIVKRSQLPHYVEDVEVSFIISIIIIIIIYKYMAALAFRPRNGELRTQKLNPIWWEHLNYIPLKPGVGQYIAIHATLTAMDFFLAYFYPSGPFTCIFSKTSSDFFLLVVANTGSCVGLQLK